MKTKKQNHSRQPTQQGGELDKTSDGLSSALGSPADTQNKKGEKQK